MRVIGIILIVLQCFAVFGTISSGGEIFKVVDVRSFFNLIGYFWFAILGVIFILIGNKKAKQKGKNK